MEGLWRPSRFGWIYPLAVVYTQTLTMPNAITLHQVYGESLHKMLWSQDDTAACVDAGACLTVPTVYLHYIHQRSAIVVAQSQQIWQALLLATGK